MNVKSPSRTVFLLALWAFVVLLVYAFGQSSEGREEAAAEQESAPSEQDAQQPVAAGAANPHGSLAIPCSECHSTEGWTPLAENRSFDHGDTGLPLVAAHREVACFDCHGDLQFNRVASACADCHRDPHQGELGLSCESCHDPRGWDEARQEMRDRHATTLFPLTGAHLGVDCAACHGGTAPAEFSVTPTPCFSCHQQDYQQARNPNHLGAGFPTTCEVCHTTDEWEGADFRGHDNLFFPIFSGPHRGVWGSCSNCHVAQNNFAVFSCFQCHSRGEMRDEHDDVRGYVYDSQACFTCHPDGRE